MKYIWCIECQHFEDSVSSSSPESNFYQHPRFQVKIQKDVVQKQKQKYDEIIDS